VCSKILFVRHTMYRGPSDEKPTRTASDCKSISKMSAATKDHTAEQTRCFLGRPIKTCCAIIIGQTRSCGVPPHLGTFFSHFRFVKFFFVIVRTTTVFDDWEVTFN
jgi:hypothetical protein